MTASGWFPAIGNKMKQWIVSDDTVPENTPFWIDGNALVHYDGTASKVMVPETVTAISEDAFSNNSSVCRVLIPDSVRKIGSDTFRSCSKLRSVRLPQKLSVLESGLFECCHMLQAIQIPRGIREIGDRAFFGCTQLNALSLPKSLEKIAPDAFLDCPDLVLYIPAGTYAAKFARKHGLVCRVIPRRDNHSIKWNFNSFRKKQESKLQ